jgi:hypothetical protein
MRAARWFRAAAVVMLLFAVGHTYGFLVFRPDSAEGRAVWDAMNRVRFSVGNTTFSYGGFYIGFGLFISAFQVFCIWLAWTLGSMARPARWQRVGLRGECLCCSALGLSFRCGTFLWVLWCCR